MLTEIRPIEYFKELVATAIRRQRVEADETAEFYLSSLLAGFLGAGAEAEEPLAMLFIKALGSGREEQGRAFKRLGDISLFTAGFFSDSLARRAVDMDYYAAMGAASYGYLATLHREAGRGRALHTLFSALAARFGAFADVLSEVSERTRLTSPRDVLRLYERWLKTGSRRAERLLRELGIDPVAVTTRPVH
jgi:hypothetical protein